MKTSKYTALFIIKIILCTICFAQTRKIDSLKKALPSLKDSARIDCLNALSEAYTEVQLDTPIEVQIDTVEIFALKALEEAKKINYVHGMAKATSLKATVSFDKYNNYSEAGSLAHEAILLYEKTSNKKGLNRTFYELGHALYVQSYFEEAIKNFNISYDLSRKAGDSIYVLYSVITSAYVYLESGDYKKAFEKVLDLHHLVLKNNDSTWKFWELTLIVNLYISIEDFKTALMYCQQIFQITKPTHYKDLLGIAELFSLTQQFDSAKYYYSLVDTVSYARALRFYLVSIGQYYFLQGKYNKALPNFLRGLNYHKQVNDRNQVMQTLVNLAKAYDSVHNYTLAFKYASEALMMSRQTGARQFIRDCYQILYSVHDHWQQTDSALFYHKKYVAIKDSITSAQIAARLVAYNFDQKIQLLNKEKEIQQAKLQEESFQKKILIASIVGLTLLGGVIFRNIRLKRKNERQRLEHELDLQQLESDRTNAELQRQASELEMQALRAQMNPHFIFNCLSSINRFILKNESEPASDYLTKFSRLIRMVLTNSKKAFISLEDELEMLKLYLEMERLRFRNSFEYNVTFKNEIDPENVFMPPLLLQPFAENAIWHGLMHKQGHGHLDIALSLDQKILTCMITDDGIGREKAALIKSKSSEKQKSMGLQITAERLALLNRDIEAQTFFDIEDVTDDAGNIAGTRAILKIHYKTMSEAFV